MRKNSTLLEPKHLEAHQAVIEGHPEGLVRINDFNTFDLE